MRVKIVFIVCVLGFISETALSQSYSLISPYQTILTHVRYMEEDNYHPEIAAKVFNPKRIEAEEAEKLAVQLIQIYKGAGILIDYKKIPTSANYIDTLSEKHIYVIDKKYPQIYLVKEGRFWYFSQETEENIDQIHKQVYPFGVDKLLELFPKMGDAKYFGLHLWQILGILIIIILSVIIHKLFTFIIEKIIINLLIKRGHGATAKKYVAPVAKPLSILIIFPILLLLTPVIQLPIKINSYVMFAFKALWPVFLTIVVYRLVDLIGMYMSRLADKTESTLDDQLVPMIRKALKIFVIIIGALAILVNLNVDIVPFLTGLSIGGLAFALAAQDTLKNFFGSIMIFLDKPFQIGDWITSGNIDGTVEEVGFRATRIRTFRNSLTYVPNGKIADSTVDNHGLRNYRRFYTHIAITYDTPSDLINIFVEGLREIVEKHPHTRKDNYHVYLNDMADSSLNVMFYIFFEVPTWGEELRCRHEILIEIIRLAQSLGVNFAFPTTTLHMETFPEKKGNSPEYKSDAALLEKQLQAFIKKPKDWEKGNN
ncbi:MAG: mechanosensitive ion channel family protein [Cytophagales bacterium]|nr:mechanosensitive ion channel family protein [Cytophagales bacterium]